MDYSEALHILHWIFITIFLGGQFYYLLITQPASFGFFSQNDQVFFLQNTLKRQNPILMLALCLAVVSGGFMITAIKSSLGTSYFASFGQGLMVKLGFFFIVFFITAYQTLAVGFKIRYLDPAKAESHILPRQLKIVRTQMTITSLMNIVMTIYVIYLGRHL